MKAKANPKAVTKPDEKQPLVLKPALIVFGTDRTGKPHAAWFTAEEAEAARTAAGLIGYRVLALTTEAQAQVAAKLSRGRLFENGRAFVPFVKAALYETLSQMADAAPERTEAAPADAAAPQEASADARAPAPEPVRSLPVVVNTSVRRGGPRDWDEIEPGSLVLAYDREYEAWYEAIVVQVLGSAYRVRFRDYPEEGVLMRRRENIALLFVPEPETTPQAA
jgi:hypothetical protein